MKLSSLHHVGLIQILAAMSFACSGDDTDSTGGTSATSSGGATGGGLVAGGATGGGLSSGGTTGGGPPSGGATGGGSSLGGASGGGSSLGGTTGGSASSGGAGTVPSSCDVMPIIQTSCAGIICHGSPGEPAMYNTDLLNPPEGKTVGEMLLGREANYSLVADSSLCPTEEPELLINPTHPSESLILKKLMGTQACGVAMPSTQSHPMDQVQIDCFVDWVDAVTGQGGTGEAGADGMGTGGMASGGTASGGTASGGTASGGTASGGTASGGTASGGTASGGASTGGTSSGVPATFETVQLVLTQNVTTCVGSDCHGGHEGRLDLQVNDGLLERLTSSASEICQMPIVDPGSPENSALVKVLTEGCGDVSPNCLIGTECIPRMPIDCADGFDCIPAEYVEAIQQWIAAGAEP